MKTKTVKNTKVKFVFIILFLLFTNNSFAISRCEQKVLGYNMLLTGLATWGFSKINGERADLKTFALGNLAGAGHHFARKNIHKGKEVWGLAQSYFWGSVTENLTLGNDPFSHVRYGVGPFSLRIKLGTWQIEPEVDVVDLSRILYFLVKSDVKDIRIEKGVFVSKDNGAVDSDEFTNGATFGTLVSLKENILLRDEVMRHEVSHVSQSLQWNSFGSKRLGKYKTRKRIRVGWFDPVISELDHTQNYEDRFFEREAFNNCSTSFTIQKKF